MNTHNPLKVKLGHEVTHKKIKEYKLQKNKFFQEYNL